MRKYMADRYERRLAWAKDLLGGKCRCGSVKDLQFDHVDPAIKSFTICTKLAGVSLVRLEQELAKCQLLCFDCHKLKTAAEPIKGRDRSCDCCGKTFVGGKAYAGHRRWHTNLR